MSKFIEASKLVNAVSGAIKRATTMREQVLLVAASCLFHTFGAGRGDTSQYQRLVSGLPKSYAGLLLKMESELFSPFFTRSADGKLILTAGRDNDAAQVACEKALTFSPAKVEAGLKGLDDLADYLNKASKRGYNEETAEMAQDLLAILRQRQQSAEQARETERENELRAEIRAQVLAELKAGENPLEQEVEEHTQTAQAA